MSVSIKALEKRLLEAGNNLLDLSPSSETLLGLVNELYSCLSEVEHNPPSLIKNALSPSIKALVAAKLFRHSDYDVKISVPACICQITRIIAPDAPYDDEKMMEVFRLIVSSFEHLSQVYSYSYAKRIVILETLSKLRISNVMLDLKCDALLIEMFQHFLKALRDDHPIKVILCMENIMTVVLQESNDIPPELLSPILHYVKKDDKVPQVSLRLAEQVLIRCASKLKTCLAEAVKASGVSLDKYSDVVASICEGIFSGLKQNEVVAHQNEAETGTHKRAQNESCSLHEVHDEMEKTTAAMGEHSYHKAEPERKKLPKPCSNSDQLAMVKKSILDIVTSVRQFRSELETKEQSIVDILTSVRQFRSEIKNKEDNLEAFLQVVDVLGEKIMGINKILNS